MLRLNSQHGQNYFRDEPSSSQAYNPNEKYKKNTLRSNNYSEENPPQQYSNDYTNNYTRKQANTQNYRNQCEEINRPPNQQYAKNRYSMMNEYSRASPALKSSNYAVQKPSTFDQPKQYSNRSSFAGRQRYGNPTNSQLQQNLNGKKEFLAKHSKRNEEVKSRLSRDTSACQTMQQYGRSYARQENRYPKYQPQEEQPRQSQYQFNNYQQKRQEEDDQFMQNQRFARKLNFQQQTNSKYNIPGRALRNNTRDIDLYEKVQTPRLKYENETLTDRSQQQIVSRDVSQRRTNLIRETDATPIRSNKSCNLQPGSAEKKRSLIEKSQMLQQKLKKLTAQSGRQTSNFQQESSSPINLQKNNNQTVEDFNYRRVNIQNNYSKPLQTRKTMQSRNQYEQSQQNFKARPLLNQNQAARNHEVLRVSNTNQQDLSSNMSNQGDAIQKIMQLNEKINERIQSIISNYTKK